MKVLNYGSLNIDYVYKVDHIVQPGETLSVKNLEIYSGGKGLNQSIALARANVKVFQAGRIGNDSEGKLLLETCKSNNISTRYIDISEEKSGHTIIQVDKNGENCILLFGGSNKCQEQKKIDFIIEQFEKGDLILLQNEINNLNYIMEKAFEKGMIIVLNPSPYNEKISECDLSKVSYLILNEVEAQQMVGDGSIDIILDKILDKMPNAKIILTLGENGSIFKGIDEIYSQEIFPTNTVDTTAAGDTFTGYFLAGILNGYNYQTSLKLATKAASIAVSRAGAVPSIPKMEEVISGIDHLCY